MDLSVSALARGWHRFWRMPAVRSRSATPSGGPSAIGPTSALRAAAHVDIAPDDPLMALLEQAQGPIDLDSVVLESPAVTALRSAGVKLMVPLISQGELIGVLSLGPRLSDQEYSKDDRRLLENLAAHAAPALRVAQLVREQAAEAQARQRIAQELEVARLIQQNFLPKMLPTLPGWQVRAHYRPAREVGGDFYDFVSLPDGQLAILIGDVTDKGIPAALVMAATRSLLRASALRLLAPGDVLQRVNELICPETPPNMFVTCFYAVLDPTSGRVRYANAGHDPPYLRRDGEVIELRARGMPLGLMTDMSYEEKETCIRAGDDIVIYSDGLVEAHDSGREMFGFPRLKALIATHGGGPTLIEHIMHQLDHFASSSGQQEDDVTLVTLTREPRDPDILDEFSVSSKPGIETVAMQRAFQAAAPLLIDAARLERFKTAVAEAVMNAIEHGNSLQAEMPVDVRIRRTQREVVVDVTDQGRGTSDPTKTSPPDLTAKLQGREPPRGWGLFLIQQMVDELTWETHGDGHTVSLHFLLPGEAPRG